MEASLRRRFRMDWWVILFVVNGAAAVMLPSLTKESVWAEILRPLGVIAMVYGGTNAVMAYYKKRDVPWDGKERREVPPSNEGD